MGIYVSTRTGRQALKLSGLGVDEDLTSDISSELAEGIVASGGSPEGQLLAMSSKQLGRGAKGPAVQDLQARLSGAGFPVDTSDGGWGVFGPKTEAALRAFQASRGIKPTGTTTTETWQAFAQGRVPTMSAPDPMALAPLSPQRSAKAGWGKIAAKHRRKKNAALARRRAPRAPRAPRGKMPRWPWLLGGAALLGGLLYMAFRTPKAPSPLSGTPLPPPPPPPLA